MHMLSRRNDNFCLESWHDIYAQLFYGEVNLQIHLFYQVIYDNYLTGIPQLYCCCLAEMSLLSYRQLAMHAQC